jgi:hypothetical protein
MGQNHALVIRPRETDIDSIRVFHHLQALSLGAAMEPLPPINSLRPQRGALGFSYVKGA